MKTIKSLIAIILLLAISSCNRVANNLSDEGLRKILPPISGLNIGMETYTVNADEGGIIMHSTGTMIKIPAHAFVDKNGNTVSGNIDISYREMHSASEIFVSGIPMTYDSADTEYHFESAGMNEIYGYKDGIPVYIDSSKTIDFCMKSTKDQTEFNMYYYDTISNQWLNKGKDIIVNIDLSEFNEPIKPVLADSNKASFTIDADYSDFPELKVYENTIFQLTDSNENKITSDYKNVRWHDVKIEKGATTGSYNILFSHYDDNVSYEVNPVFDRENIEKAMQVFEKKFEMYKTLLWEGIEKEKQEREKEHAEVLKKMSERNTQYEQEEKAQEEQALQEAKYRLEWDSVSKQMQAEAEEQARKFQEAINVNAAIYRTYSIRKFGIYNSDCPRNLPQGARIQASFVDTDGNTLQISNNITLFQLSNKMIYTYYVGNYTNFRFNPDVPNVLCAATTDGRLAYFTKDDFKKVKTSGEYTFVMRILPYKIESTDDLDAILEIS